LSSAVKLNEGANELIIPRMELYYKRTEEKKKKEKKEKNLGFQKMAKVCLRHIFNMKYLVCE